MAEAEGKSGDELPLTTDQPETTVAGELKEENKSMKSSWSGWFQKMNDAVLGSLDDENKEENPESTAGNSNEEPKGSTWGAWGTSLLEKAKEKTLSTYEMVKKDLTEFTDVVQNETAHIVSSTATTIRERAPQLVGGIVGTVNTLLVEDTTRGEEDLEVPIAVTAAIGNRSEARLYAIQSDPGTYCNEPEGAPELFDDWLDHAFNLADKKEEISHLLVTNPTIRNLFAQLVPLQVSNTIFWQRYFYKLHQFDLDEARRRALLQREEAAAMRTSNDNVKLSWGDESEPEDHRGPSDNADIDAFYDVGKDVAIDEHSLPQPENPTSQRQQSPLCGRDPPEGVSAIPKSWNGERRDSFNVEMISADDQEKPKLNIQTLLDTDISSISSLGTPPRQDGESSSPTDKKSDDWVEWEGNETGN